MKPNEPFIGFIFIIFIALLWLGFLFHQDTRFAGSFFGGVLAVTGSILLLVPALYSLIKRVPVFRNYFTKKISLAVMLTIHIYCSFIGAILVLLHTGHKFQSRLATTLTALLLIVVFSGYIGRYLLSRISNDVVQKKKLLSSLDSEYAATVVAMHARTQLKREIIYDLAESIADTEYAISTHDFFKRLFSGWLKLHIILSSFFYILLALHIGGVNYFGLRWFQ